VWLDLVVAAESSMVGAVDTWVDIVSWLSWRHQVDIDESLATSVIVIFCSSCLDPSFITCILLRYYHHLLTLIHVAISVMYVANLSAAVAITASLANVVVYRCSSKPIVDMIQIGSGTWCHLCVSSMWIEDYCQQSQLPDTRELKTSANRASCLTPGNWRLILPVMMFLCYYDLHVWIVFESRLTFNIQFL